MFIDILMQRQYWNFFLRIALITAVSYHDYNLIYDRSCIFQLYNVSDFFFNAILPCVPIQKHQYVNKGKVAATSEEQSMDSRRHCIQYNCCRRSKFENQYLLCVLLIYCQLTIQLLLQQCSTVPNKYSNYLTMNIFAGVPDRTPQFTTHGRERTFRNDPHLLSI